MNDKEERTLVNEIEDILNEYGNIFYLDHRFGTVYWIKSIFTSAGEFIGSINPFTVSLYTLINDDSSGIAIKEPRKLTFHQNIISLSSLFDKDAFKNVLTKFVSDVKQHQKKILIDEIMKE